MAWLIREEVRELFKEMGEALSQENVQRIRRFAYPMFGLRDNGTLVVLGSCFLVAIGDERLLVSAAHVFNGHVKPWLIGVPTTSDDGTHQLRFAMLRGSMRRSLSKMADDDPFDVAVVRLRPTTVAEFGSSPAISLDQLDLELRPEDVAENALDPAVIYCCLGFPSSMTKPLVRSRPVRLKAAGYCSLPATKVEYAEAKIDPFSHLAIGIGSGPSFDQTGTPRIAAKPHGISGGPVWRLRFFRTGEVDAKVVGLATEYHRASKCLVACRIWILFNLARTAFPDLRGSLPTMKRISEREIFGGPPQLLEF